MRLNTKILFFFVPDFIDIQRKSFFYFLQAGIIKEFSKRNFVNNIAKDLELILYPEYYQLNPPEWNTKQAILKAKTYSCRLYIPAQLTNYQTKEIKLKWVLLGNLPLMTKRGHFIINGSPRVIINQMIRSPGIYYQQIIDKKKKPTYYADIISHRGAWLRLEIDKKRRIWARMKKTPKVSILVFLQAMGLTKEIIFQSINYSEFLKLSFLKDNHPFSTEEALITFYSKTHPKKDKTEITSNLGQKFLFRKFLNPKTYDLGFLGRSRLNKKLGLSIPLNHHTLTPQDILYATDYLINLEYGLGSVDDIDHLKNRRVRPSGELIQNQLATGLIRLEKLIRERMKKPKKNLSIRSLLTTKPINGALREFFGSSQLSQFMDQTNPLAEITHKRRLSSLGPGGISRETAGMAVRGIHSTHYGRICPIETPEGPNAGLVNSITTYARINFQGFLETPAFQLYQGQIQKKKGPVFLSAEQEEKVIVAPGDLKISFLNFLPKNLISIRQINEFKKVSRQSIDYIPVSPIQMISIATSLIPFLEHDDANRALMGSNMQRQAVPLIKPEHPLVGTGLEIRVVSDSGHVLQALNSGYVYYVSGQKISLITKNKNSNLKKLEALKFIKLKNFLSFYKSRKIHFLNYTFLLMSLGFLFFQLLNAKSLKNRDILFSNLNNFSYLFLEFINKPKIYLKNKKNLLDLKKFITYKKFYKKQKKFLFYNNFFFYKKNFYYKKLRLQNNVSRCVKFIYLKNFWNQQNKNSLLLKSNSIIHRVENTNFFVDQDIFYKLLLKIKSKKNFTKTIKIVPFYIKIDYLNFKKQKLEENYYKRLSFYCISIDFLLKKINLLKSNNYLSTKISKYEEKSFLNFKQKLNSKFNSKSFYKLFDLLLKLYKFKKMKYWVLKKNKKNRYRVEKNLNTKKFLTLFQFPYFFFYKKNIFILKFQSAPIFVKNIKNPNFQEIKTKKKNQILFLLSRKKFFYFSKIYLKSQAFLNFKYTKNFFGLSDFKNLNTILLWKIKIYKKFHIILNFNKKNYFLKQNQKILDDQKNQLTNKNFFSLSQIKKILQKFSKIHFTFDLLFSKYLIYKFLNITHLKNKVERDILPSNNFQKTKNLIQNDFNYLLKANFFETRETETFFDSNFITSTEKNLSTSFLEIFDYTLENFNRSNQDTCIKQKPIIFEKEWIQKNEILADGAASCKGELALGKNILIGYMPWEGYNFEDAILINEKLVYEDTYTSLHIERYEIEIRDTKFGLEQITNQIPEIDFSAIAHLDLNGIAKIGSWVKEGDILVGKVTPIKKKYLTPHEKLLYDIVGKDIPNTRDTSLRVPKGVQGRVINVQILETENIPPEIAFEGPGRVHIYLAEKRKIQVGDKMAGRHGNKGIVSKILSRQDMPFLPDGTILDMVLNPLGVPSRMNVGQVFECLLGLAGIYLGQQFKIIPFDEIYGLEASRSLVYSKLYEARLKTRQEWLFNYEFPGKAVLFDGRTGECFDQPVTVGKAYMLKLVHLVDEKIHARSTGPYSLVTQQPLRGRSKHGGQRLGEMEVWALEGFGAAYILQELLTVKSDDMKGRHQVMDALLNNEPISLGTPESFKVLIRELQSLCLDVGVYTIDSLGRRKQIDVMKLS